MRQIISRIPVRSGLTREQWGAQIDEQLLIVWDETLPKMLPSNVAAADQLHVRRHELSEISSAALAVLDEIIILQAVTLGWRLMASDLVLFRFSRWSEDVSSPELFERLGKALARSARIVADAALRMKDPECERPYELPPIDDPELRQHKKLAVLELKVLLREMRTEFSCRSLKPDTQGLAEWFLNAISDNERFPMLAANPDHWAAFLENGENADALKLQLEKRIEPAGLFDSWLGWLKGHDREYLRKKLTSLSSHK